MQPLSAATGRHLALTSRSQFVEIVRADLAYLRDEWDDTVDDHSLRRSSTVLRRLLVQGDLLRAWREVGLPGQPQITASTLAPVLARVPRSEIRFAAAGGAKYQGAELRGALLRNRALSAGDVKRSYEDGMPSNTQSLTAFTDAICVIVKGKPVSRRLLIKYVANKLGGAHVDTRRGPKPEDQIFALLDGARDITLLGKPAVYFELLSIGQALSAAEDVDRFLDAAGACTTH